MCISDNSSMVSRNRVKCASSFCTEILIFYFNWSPFLLYFVLEIRKKNYLEKLFNIQIEERISLFWQSKQRTTL